MTVTTTEPFIGLSPFIFGDPKHNSQGLVGINSLNFMMNVGEPNRMFSYAGPGDDAKPVGSIQSIRLGHINTSSSSSSTSKEAFSSCKVLCNFLTAQDTDVIDAKNVVPYLDFPRFITNGTEDVNALTSNFSTDYKKLDSYSIQTNNIQLNQLPDYFIVVVRKPMINQTITDSSTFLAIKKITVSLSNSQGLLSNAEQVDLWKMSVRNGSSQSFEEFSGLASSGDGARPERTLTTGSLLIINPALDLSLPSYLSNGSIGQFNFTMNITYENIFTGAAFNPEVCVICCNSGSMTTISGSSMRQTGLLTKDIVINSSSKDSMPFNTYSRMIGGNLTDRALTNVKKLFPKLKKLISGSGVRSGGGMKNSNLDEFI